MKSLFIILILTLVLAVAWLTSCNGSAEGWKQAGAAKDSMIKYIRGERAEDRRKFDSTIGILIKRDAALQLQKQTVHKQYEKIPTDINSLDREQLRRELASY